MAVHFLVLKEPGLPGFNTADDSVMVSFVGIFREGENFHMVDNNYFESMDYVSPLGGGTYWSSEIQLDESGDEIVVHAKKWPWLPIIINCICVGIFFSFFFYYFSKDDFLSGLKYFAAFVAVLTILGICVGVHVQNIRAKVPKIFFSHQTRHFSFPKYARVIEHKDVLLFQLIIGDGWGGANLMECNVIVKEGENTVRYPVFRSGSIPQKVKTTMETFVSKTGVPLQCVTYGIYSSPKSIRWTNRNN